MQDVIDNHEEAAGAAPQALRLCELVMILTQQIQAPGQTTSDVHICTTNANDKCMPCNITAFHKFGEQVLRVHHFHTCANFRSLSELLHLLINAAGGGRGYVRGSRCCAPAIQEGD